MPVEADNFQYAWCLLINEIVILKKSNVKLAGLNYQKNIFEYFGMRIGIELVSPKHPNQETYHVVC